MTAEPRPVALRRVSLLAVCVGVLGLILTVLGGLAGNPAGFFRAYLFGHTFWVGLGLGSLGVVLIQRMLPLGPKTSP